MSIAGDICSGPACHFVADLDLSLQTNAAQSGSSCSGDKNIETVSTTPGLVSVQTAQNQSQTSIAADVPQRYTEYGNNFIHGIHVVDVSFCTQYSQL
jgi:hypothetical protein